MAAAGMANPLVDPLEPDFNGGLLNPLLEWAGKALPDRLTADSPAGVLHRVVTADNRTAESLGSIFGGWLSGRMRSHAPYFALSGLLTLTWLTVCCCLLAATLCKERRRRRRLMAATSAAGANADQRDWAACAGHDDGDVVDSAEAAAAAASSAAASPARYRLFYSMLVRRYRGYRADGNGKSNGSSKSKSNNIGSNGNGSIGGQSDDSGSGLGGGVDSPDASSPVVRAALLSAKALSGRDRRLVGHASASAIVGLVCAAFLVAYFTQAGGLVAFTSTAQSSRGVRTIVVATVGHLDRFLTRSLAESNRTIINMFERAYPPVERLFLDFGEELLDSLMADYKIDRLIQQLEAFLGTINATMGAMRDIAGARETAIKPLQQFAAQLEVHRDGLKDPLREVCIRHQVLFPAGRCLQIADRLPDLRLAINDTKLETDSSVTMVTLLNKMLKLDIDNVQQQVQKAKDSLSTGLRAISGVVRQLLGSLVDAVSAQFDQAESAIAQVKAGFDRVATDPQLWGLVEGAGRAVLALVILSCLVFALTCTLGAVLLWALIRYLRIAFRLDRYAGADDAGVVAVATSPSELSASSPSPLRSSSSTSGFSSGGATSRASPQWPAPPPPPPPRPPPPPPPPGRFSERWLDLDVDCADCDLPAGVGRPVVVDWQGSRALHQRKLHRLVAKEWNGFVYCCSFDCSLALLVGALLSLLPLLFGLAFFYASGEVQADACRYLATGAGNQRWDGMLDEFAGRRLWPLVDDALRRQPDLPIRVPRYPDRMLRAVRAECGDANRTLFGIFGLTGLLNATALLEANGTRARFQEGSDLVKDQINATDANSLIPPELDSLTSVLPQLAGVLDAEDYAGSIEELGKPILVMPNAAGFVADVDRLAAEVQAAVPDDSSAAIVRHTVGLLNASLARSAGLRERLDRLRQRYRLLQDSRNITNMTVGLLAALDAVRLTLADKAKMLEMVDVRFRPTLERHLPKFAAFLDPLAADLLDSVGHCDDLHRALETVAVSLCSEAVPQANLAAFLLLLTTLFFAVMFALSWWLLVRVGRHQAAVAQFEICAIQAARAPSVASLAPVSTTAKAAPAAPAAAAPAAAAASPAKSRVRFGESAV